MTKSTVYVDLNDTNPQVVLSAGDLFGNYCQASWKYADTDNVEIYPSGNRLQVIMNKPGSVKITAEYGSRTATVTVKAAKLATGMYITTKDGKNLDVDKNGSWFVQVASGKNVELKAKVHNAASSKVTWSIVSGGEYAKISSSGKLTANKNVTSTKKVVVQATTEDGSRLQERIPVFVKPLATGIMVYTLEKDAQMRTLALSNNERMINRSNTQLIWDMNTNPVFWVYSTVFPFFENDSIGSAIQTVTWKSSSPKVATISSNGMVTCQKPGTATITCSAADGSGQKISFKLTVVKRMERITLKDAVVVAGKSITLKPDISPEDTTNKKLEWRIEGDTAFASVDSNGKLTARKVTAIKSVTVFAVAADGSGVYGKCTVWIYPKSVKSVSILSGNKDVSGDTLTLRVGNSINLNYMITPYNAPMDVTWSS